jgi:hypothetical protein
MAKKTRNIPTVMLAVKGNGIPNLNSLYYNETFLNVLFKETFEAINDAFKNKRKIAVLFELDKSDHYVEIERSQWKLALQSCLDKLIEKEDYLKCIPIKELMGKI